jgi:hypothetical protein
MGISIPLILEKVIFGSVEIEHRAAPREIKGYTVIAKFKVADYYPPIWDIVRV